MLLRYSQQFPEQVSVYLLHNKLPVKPITYADLNEGAARYANALKQRGIKRGDVVIIILNHGEDLLFAFFGAVLAGAIPSIMPFLTEKLSPAQYRTSLAALYKITQPAAVITYPEFKSEVVKAREDGTEPSVIILPSDLSPVSSPDLKQMDGLYADPDDTVLLQHSSGTTGLQKGVALTHRAVFNQLSSYSKSIRLEPEDFIVSWLPLYHDMGLIAGFLLPILLGIPLALMSPFDWVRAPYKLLQAISDFSGTLCWLPNFAYNFCAQKIRDRDLQGIDLSSCRALINCSEPMYWGSHQMFLERFSSYGFKVTALATSYAMAENVFAVTQGGIDTPITTELIDRHSLTVEKKVVIAQNDAQGVKMLSAGRPLTNTFVRVVDPQGSILPERYIGEIAIRSNCMLTGYYNRPDLTEQAFLDGWYLTGDLGYLANGELYITGRKKDLIIVGGKNIYPQDLEMLAGGVDGVHPGRVVAFGVINEKTGTEDVVIIAEVDKPDRELKLKIADDIRARVTRGSDIALRYVRIVDRGWLLKTSSGKIARTANREKFLDELESQN